MLMNEQLYLLWITFVLPVYDAAGNLLLYYNL